MRGVTVGVVLIAIASLALGATACDTGGTNEKYQDQRKSAVKERATTFSRAESIAPTPKTVNFPLRKALVEFTERQDLLNHPWFVYILADTGNIIGYYVARTVPVNACNFLSSTEVVDSGESGKVVLTAPSLDGIFYGGAGASSGCDAWFFFDSATNALIQIRGVNFFTSDQPLRVNADPIRVKGK